MHAVDHVSGYVEGFARTFTDASGEIRQHLIAENTMLFYSKHRVLVDMISRANALPVFGRLANLWLRCCFLLGALSYMNHLKEKQDDNMFWTSMV
jgi:hypothetical protein